MGRLRAFLRALPMNVGRDHLPKELPYVIAIEGSIGAGKTAYLKKMDECYINVKFVPEPRNMWTDVRLTPGDCEELEFENSRSQDPQFTDDRYNILRLRFQDPARYAWSMQIWALITRIETIKQAVKEATEDEDIDFVIVERSWEANRLFAEVLYEENQISEIERAMYEAIFKEVSLVAPNIHGFVFICNHLDIVCERVRDRQRREEQHLNEWFLERLLMKYEDFKEQLDDTNRDYIEVSGNVSLMEDPYSWEHFSRQLQQYCKRLTGRSLERDPNYDPLKELDGNARIWW